MVVAAGVVIAAACGLTDEGVVGRADGVTVQVEAGPHSVLTAVVEVESDDPVRPALAATAEDGHTVQVPARGPAATEHELALVGLRPETEYALTLTGSSALAEASEGLRIQTGVLPEDLPAVVVEADGRAAEGATLFNASAGADGLEHPGNLIAVDETGEVVWYHQAGRSMTDVRQLPNGNLLFNWNSTGAREIDVLGNLVREWTTTARIEAGRLDRDGQPFYTDNAIVLDTIRLHHEVADLLPNGNFLALGMEVRDVAGFPSDLCGGDDPLSPGPRSQRGDLVLEYTPGGEILREVSLLDAIDPVAVPGVAQCETRTDPFANDNQPFVDWTHANSAEVFYDRNLVLVSARHLNQVLALRWEDDEEGPAGELLWRLGEGGDFDLSEGEWFVEQHAPEWLADGTMLIYDNGTDRPGTIPAGGTEPPYSRAVIYEIDPPRSPGGRGTARQVWEHRATEPGGEPTYAYFLGDADLVGDDHVLVTHGAIDGGDPGGLTARIIEVERSSGDIVLDVRVPAGEIGWRSYRAEHLDTWYP